MAKSNRDRVGEIMDILKQGLGPFVLREYKHYYKGSRYLSEIEITLTTGSYSVPHLPDEETALNKIDVMGWLNLMMRQWNEVFKVKLGHSERSYVSILLSSRHNWAHQQAFTNDDALHIADIATRLLKAIGAPKQGEIVSDIAQELLRLRFESELKKSQKIKIKMDDAPSTTTPGLKPWRMVVKPHPDVSSGRYVQAEFAADLAQVVQGKADPEYGDPKEFFNRTYLTEGLSDLLITGIKRLTGQGGDPVVQLQTSFGGGKTHSMLALYHLLGGQIGFNEIPNSDSIIKKIGGVDNTLTANRAVIVGTAFSATESRQYDDCTTNTLWGDIAYQIGGLKGYKMVEKADLTGVSPGSDTILSVLEEFGPVLIIIDELVAFARNLYGVVDRLPAGTFESVMTFMQSLTEAVKRASDSMLLISIPESDIEIGGEGGKAALTRLAATIGRVEAVWKPVTATESFEIVRRRLFSSDIDHASRDAVIKAFREMYASNSGEFPSGVAEGDYTQRMLDAYPIHPELFARLYEDWSTLERFQRTRGVLRLMATVIHRLWTDDDKSLMIMPASIPLWAATVRNEMLRYLPENWPAIVDADIDGEGSKPFQIDKSVPNLGQYAACRRVARAIFVGSAPTATSQSVRGVEEVRIRLATVQPGEQVAAFNDALRRMSNQLMYLYTDGGRYWYDTHPTVNRMAQDRAQNVSLDDAYMEAIKRLRTIKYRKDDFNGVHIAPQESGNVVDDWRARVVVLAPEYFHKKGNGVSEAQGVAKEILENRGNAPRLYRNMLVFIAPDATNVEAWVQSLREYLAWKSIEDETEQLNLDAQQRKQVATNLKRTEETLLSRLEETYSWLIVPSQPDPTGPIDYQAHRISGQDSFYDRAARKLRQSELLITRWSPDNLVIEMDRFLWRDADHLGVKKLWEYLARYCYLPRLYDENVLVDAIKDGVSRPNAAFGYAANVEDDGKYTGLVFGNNTSVYLNEHSVIIKADVAREAVEIIVPPIIDIGVKGGSASGQIAPPPLSLKKTRYHGTVSVNPQRMNKDVSAIVEEVIERLTSLTGTDIEVTIEISAKRSDGFDDAVVRTINENSRTLKFKNHGFED